MKQSISKLSNAITQEYIAKWAIPLHNGKLDLKMEIEDGLEQLLMDICERIINLNHHELILDIAILFQLHLRNVSKGMKAEQSEESFTKASKDLRLQNAFKRLMLSFNFHDYLSSDLVFETVNKILVKQVSSGAVSLDDAVTHGISRARF